MPACILRHGQEPEDIHTTLSIDSAYNAVVASSVGGGDTVVWTGEREIAAVERHTERRV